MLKQRVITAIILALVFLSALFGLSPQYFPLFIGLVVLISAWEWANLSGTGAIWQRLVYCGFIAAILFGLGQTLGLFTDNQTLDFASIKLVLLIGCGWWVVALLLVKGYPASVAFWGNSALRLAMGVLVLVPTWLALVYVRFQPQGAWLVLMIIGVVATADIGGYFTGRKFGKHKLAPAVSPGKTLEGFAGGLVANLILAMIIAYAIGGNVALILAVVVPTSLFSVLGDLLESMVKRHAGVKDSGVILPGHGGVLDRVDSITAAAPVFAFALLATGWTPGV